MHDLEGTLVPHRTLGGKYRDVMGQPYCPFPSGTITPTPRTLKNVITLLDGEGPFPTGLSLPHGLIFKVILQVS